MKKKHLMASLIMPILLLVGCNNTVVENTDTTTTPQTTIAETTTAETTTAETTKAETTPAETTEATQLEVTEVDTSPKIIALTFDDGPNLTTTVQMLDVIEKYEIPASFFLIGNNINDKTAEVVKRAYDMGCDIENHSKTHSYMHKMTEEELIDEITYTSDKIEEIIGVRPLFFRPPYLSTSSTMLETIDLTFISGVMANDWEDAVTVEKRAESIIKQARDGGIILLHDTQGNSKTVDAIDIIIPELLSQGYQFVTISELFEMNGVDGIENKFVYSNVFQTK